MTFKRKCGHSVINKLLPPLRRGLWRNVIFVQSGSDELTLRFAGAVAAFFADTLAFVAEDLALLPVRVCASTLS